MRSIRTARLPGVVLAVATVGSVAVAALAPGTTIDQSRAAAAQAGEFVWHDLITALPYVRVADPAAMAERVKQLGGSVLLLPDPGIRNGSLAVVLDPAGAPLALQKFPFTSSVTP